MSNKVRLDQLLVERGLADSRAKAQALIMAGRAVLQGRSLQKVGQLVPADAEVVLKEGPRYVSRGGLKLESVAQELGLDFQGKTVLDVGSSTGGFTDFAVQQGAAKVYAVDVGTAQLDQKLRNDPRVVAMERTDIRDVIARNEVPKQSDADRRAPLAMTIGLADIALVDVSFISLRKVLSSVAGLIKPGGQIVAMAKPQFEADKPTADRHKGAIKDPKVRSSILEELEGWLKEHYDISGYADSEIAGAKGNLERFYLLRPKS